MSGGIDALFDNLIQSEKAILHLTFGFTPQDDEHIRARLSREGSRLALAGDKIFHLFICEFTPNPIYTGEFISFFGSNMVMTIYVTDFLRLPFDYRPGVNPIRLGDLFMAFLSLSCLKRPAFEKMNYTVQLDNMDRARTICGNVIKWVVGDKQMATCTLEELRRDVQERAKESKQERMKEAKEIEQASLNVDDYNAWRRNEECRPLPPLKTQHPVVKLRYMTRSGQERQLLACICCAAVEPKDCKCTPLEVLKNGNQATSTTSNSKAHSTTTASGGIIGGGNSSTNTTALAKFTNNQQQQQPTSSAFGNFAPFNMSNSSSSALLYGGQSIFNINNNNNNNNVSPPPSSNSTQTFHSDGSASSGRTINNNNNINNNFSSNASTTPTIPSSISILSKSLTTSFHLKDHQLPRFHFGTLEECRLTKTKALKLQNIAIWSCCGAEAAKVNTSPIGYEVIPEHVNGCCGPSSSQAM